MCREFWKVTAYDVPSDDDSMMVYINIAFDHGMLAVIDDGGVVGFCAGCKAPLMGNANYMMGVELAWWVNPDHRNGKDAIGLMKFIEKRAKDAGVHYWNMVAMESSDPDRACKIYERLGYQKTERQYMKVL